MIYFTQAEIEHWLAEDVPYYDETTRALGIAGQLGILTIKTREDSTVLCGAEEAVRMADILGLHVLFSHPSGYYATHGEIVLRVKGLAGALHQWWRVAVVLLSHASGIASQTYQLVQTVHAVKPTLHVATTRRIPPGNRKLMVKAVLTGGGLIHRLGLSESVLVFAHHRLFCPSGETMSQLVQRLRNACPEKRITIEAESAAEAIEIALAHADGVQCDKLSADELQELVPTLKHIKPDLLISATGGINLSNAVQYAKSGVDMLITSSVYHAPPADFGVTMTAQ